MRRFHPPSGLRHGLDVLIQADWTPEQALAVFELLDDLRERVWVHYQRDIAEQLRQERQTSKSVPEVSDPPF